MKESGFSQPQRLSQKQSDKNRSIKLVVVMSAVDWWKSARMRGLACDFARRCRVDIRAKLRKKEAAAVERAIRSKSAHI
jgi:hypothetical protein